LHDISGCLKGWILTDILFRKLFNREALFLLTGDEIGERFKTFLAASCPLLRGFGRSGNNISSRSNASAVRLTRFSIDGVSRLAFLNAFRTRFFFEPSSSIPCRKSRISQSAAMGSSTATAGRYSAR